LYSITVGIPTKNRSLVIKVLLDSILRQTMLPNEVLIVDDSTTEETKILVTQMVNNFSAKNVSLRYLKGGGEGVAQARNIGINNSTSEIYCSIDDDVVLKTDYLKEIIHVYSVFPNALGVAGHVENLQLSAFSNGVGKVFSFFYTEQDKCRISPTGLSYPQPLTQIISCEWLSGTNSSYKKELVKNFKFDENFKKYSLCEDMDFSYRIQKKYPKSLLMTPYAKVIHTYSQLDRIPKEHSTYMEIANHTYFFFKNIKLTFKNTLVFIYGISFGRIALSFLSRNPKKVVFTIKAQLSTIRNLRNIRRGIFKSF
jgi:glycosyltransferase involved in cell wall biosynthesis